MKRDVLIAGFGGQGVLLMGQLLAEAAMDEGFHVTWFPSYGPEMRGGTANCTTVYSDEEIGSPISSKYDFVIAMNQPSMERFAPRVRTGGFLLVNASMVPVRCSDQSISAIYVPTAEIAREVGNERVGNVVMLGALLGLDAGLGLESLAGAIERVIGKKRPDAIEANLAALHAGRAAACREFGLSLSAPVAQ
ncbi:MAG: 2-oxoacid:acceptor oxidoreductase family protein [Planctomycetes bacterium]|nr:2-oxoacid:acceptor oxidoreductase family protein [Planctomycetota bacterium]